MVYLCPVIQCDVSTHGLQPVPDARRPHDAVPREDGAGAKLVETVEMGGAGAVGAADRHKGVSVTAY